MAATPKLLDMREVAERVGVKWRTVQGWCRDGLIRSVTIPGGPCGRYRVPEAEVARICERGIGAGR